MAHGVVRDFTAEVLTAVLPSGVPCRSSGQAEGELETVHDGVRSQQQSGTAECR